MTRPLRDPWNRADPGPEERAHADVDPYRQCVYTVGAVSTLRSSGEDKKKSGRRRVGAR